MAESYKTYTGDGATTSFNPTIAYLAESHIKVYLDDALQTDPTHYDWVGGQIVFVTPPASGSTVLIQRVTPRPWGSRGVDFSVQTFLDKGTLDTNQKWVWYIMQEAHETDDGGKVTPTGAEYIRWNSVRSEWDARRSGTEEKMGGLADPVGSDDAATKAYVDSVAQYGVGGVPEVFSGTGDGATKTFTLTNGSNIETNMCVVGVQNASDELLLQIPTTDYVITKKDPSSEITFTTAPASGKKWSVMNLGTQRVGTTLGDGSVEDRHLAASAVTSSKIATDAVINDHLSAGIVTAAELASDAVTLVKILDGVITKAKLDTSAFTSAPGGGTDQALLIDEGSGDLLQRVLAAADISDIATWLAAQSLSQLAVPTGDVSWNSKKITNLATPTLGTDAANRAYVDSVGSTNQSKIVRVAQETLGVANHQWDWTFTPGSSYDWYDVFIHNIQNGVASRDLYLRYYIGTWYEVKIMDIGADNWWPVGGATNPAWITFRFTEHDPSGTKLSWGKEGAFGGHVSIAGTVTQIGLRFADSFEQFNAGVKAQVYGGSNAA